MCKSFISIRSIFQGEMSLFNFGQNLSLFNFGQNLLLQSLRAMAKIGKGHTENPENPGTSEVQVEDNSSYISYEVEADTESYEVNSQTQKTTTSKTSHSEPVTN